jgi:hypothetical protein
MTRNIPGRIDANAGPFQIFLGVVLIGLSVGCQRIKGCVLTKVVDTERRLVAIFAADVHGYSRLMGSDEVGTLRDLTQRRATLDGLIASHRGRRLDEARKAAAQLRELAPSFRIAHVRTLFPLRRPEDLAKCIEGLRLAGLSE